MKALYLGPARQHSALVPVRVATDLTGVPAATVERWLSEGRVYSERIRGSIYVSLDDVEHRASMTGPGGINIHDD